MRLGHPDSSHALTEVVETSIGWEPTLSRGRQFMVRDHNGDGRDDLLIVSGVDTDDDGHSDEARVTWLKSTGNDFEVIDIGESMASSASSRWGLGTTTWGPSAC